MAKALFSAGDWSVLSRAAGDPSFTMGGSELLPGGGSEVFQMCVHVFQPKTRLCKWATAEMLDWADRFGPNLAVEQIRDALPSELLASVDKQLEKQLATGAYLRMVAGLVEKSADPIIVMHVYGVLARTVWPLKEAIMKKEAAQSASIG